MNRDIDAIAVSLHGRKIDRVERRDNDWLFAMEGGVVLTAECPWRVIVSGRIALADEDDGQWFGNAKATGVAHETERLLGGKPIVSCSISEVADLTCTVSDGTRLEIWCNSSGYESWSLQSGEQQIIATGGGILEIHQAQK